MIEHITTSLTMLVAQFHFTQNDLGLPNGKVDQGTIPKVLSIVFTIMGAVCLLVITIAGLKYTMSMGDPGATKKAKDTILYAFIGLFVAILATAIVDFVVSGVS